MAASQKVCALEVNPRHFWGNSLALPRLFTENQQNPLYLKKLTKIHSVYLAQHFNTPGTPEALLRTQQRYTPKKERTDPKIIQK